MKKAGVLAVLILTCAAACEEEVKETPRVKPKPPLVASPSASPNSAPVVNPNPIAGQPTANCNPSVTPDLCNALLDPRIKAKVDACKLAAQGASNTGINPQTGQPYPSAINPQTGQPVTQPGVQPNLNALAACESTDYIARLRAEVAIATGTIPNTLPVGGAQNPANPNPMNPNPANPNPVIPANTSNGPQCAQAYTTGKEIRIRSTKSATGTILFNEVQPGRIILVITPAADWTQVEFEGRRGFIASQNTSCQEPSDSVFANLERPKCYLNPLYILYPCKFNGESKLNFNSWTEIKTLSFNHTFQSDPKFKWAKIQLDTGGICYMEHNALQLKCLKQ